MNHDTRRKWGPNQGSGAPHNNSVGARKPRKENIRFGVNHKKGTNTLVIDEHIQEATPEHLRIEIDKIINDFLADPGKTEYIFPPDLNNLQRKYIHYKAQIMNIGSKSYGRDPNRQLHLNKKPKQLTSQSFQINLCEESTKELEEFDKKYEVQTQPTNYRAVKRNEKVYGRLQDTAPVVPKIANVEEEVKSVREKLPIFAKKDMVMKAINENQVIVISSETGSGKTTQIPQYIMEEASLKNIACKIICTQPRRISTVAAAERVSYERGETVGGSVGYHIRLESKCGHNTNLMYCTVGVFLRNLMCGNKCLNNITHVIVDEIHERDKLSDFMLICLRQNLPVFPHLRVILMSATVDTTKFQEYFQSSTVLTIPGRLFSIQSFFLEDILSLTKFFTPQMRLAMNKEQQRQAFATNYEAATHVELSEQDQENLNCALEAYMNFSDEYDYRVHYEEATADLLQLFISEDVPVDQQHSERGWTALMIASHLGDLEFISKLYNMGASLNVSDSFGKTAYDYARATNKDKTLNFLEIMKEQKSKETTSPNTDDAELLRLYDKTTPDDFIDYDLIVALIKHIHANSETGSILVFLPGYDEIMRCNDNITDSDLDIASYRMFFLHSSMNMKEQRDVFKRLPNKRKIILSTNIAETSITVEDVVFVIDVGKAKEKVYDSYNKLSALQTQWISRACAKQREGRAGRVDAGFCFKLYSKQRFSHMAEERVPEILRVSLEELCLNAKIIAPRSMNIYNFLSLAPDPPTANSVAAAIENLQSLGALDKEEDLTRLGEYLAQLTLEPRLGKMLIYSCIFKCLEPILTLAATMAQKDPFQLPPQANLRTAAAAKRRELVENVASDHVIYLRVFQIWQQEVANGRSKQFCRDYFLSESTMFSVLETRRQLLGQLRAVGFVNNTKSIDEFNVNSESWGLVKAVMSAAFFPNVAYPAQRGLSLATRNEKKVTIHNTSSCSSKVYEYWCFYDEMVKNRISFMVRGVTLLTELPVALMCGIDTIYTSSHSITVDDWLEFYFGDSRVVKFRKAVEALVEKSMLNPSHSTDPTNQIVSATLRKVMDLEESRAELVQPKTLGVRPKFVYGFTRHERTSAKKNNVVKNDTPITRSGMREPSGSNFNGTSTNGWNDYYKQDRAPKRYIPPHKYNMPNNFAATNSLSFNNFGPRSSGVSDVSRVAQMVQSVSLSSGTQDPNPAAAALLRGLTVGEDTTEYNFGRESNSRYGYYGYDRNGAYNDPNSYFVHPTGYGNSQGPSRNGTPEELTNNTSTSTNGTMGEKMVEQKDLIDYAFHDNGTVPLQTQNQDCFWRLGTLEELINTTDMSTNGTMAKQMVEQENLIDRAFFDFNSGPPQTQNQSFFWQLGGLEDLTNNTNTGTNGTMGEKMGEQKDLRDNTFCDVDSGPHPTQNQSLFWQLGAIEELLNDTDDSTNGAVECKILKQKKLTDHACNGIDSVPPQTQNGSLCGQFGAIEELLNGTDDSTNGTVECKILKQKELTDHVCNDIDSVPPQTQNGSLCGQFGAVGDLPNNTNNGTRGRKIVQQKDWADYTYNDIYSVPPQNQNHSFFGRLGALRELTNNTNTSTTCTTGRKIIKQKDLSAYAYNDIYSIPPQTKNRNSLGPFRDFAAPHPEIDCPSTSLQSFNQHEPNNGLSLQNGKSCTVTSAAAAEKNNDYLDNAIFILIKAKQLRNIYIAQCSNKWVFSPQTEKKILQLSSEGKKINLMYFAKDVKMFMGIAEYKLMNVGKPYTKPTASIKWKYTTGLHRDKTDNLRYPRENGKLIIDAHDGATLPQEIADELVRMFAETDSKKT